MAEVVIPAPFRIPNAVASAVAFGEETKHVGG